jgi:hypothetical protein
MLEPLPPTPPTETTEEIQTHEYVVADSYDYFERRALGSPDEDGDDSIADDTIKKMKKDPAVLSSLEYLRMCVFGEPLEIYPSRKPEDPEFARAIEIADFVRDCLNGMESPLSKILPQFAGAFETGHKVGEIVYRTETAGPHAGRLVLSRIKLKPRKSVGFVVDRYWNVLGFLGIDRRRNFSVANSAPILNPTDILPREKFVCWTVREEDNDPRGRSVLIAAKLHWEAKIRIPDRYDRYLKNTSQPPLVGIASDKNAAPQVDPKNPTRTMQPPEAMARALVGLWDEGNHALGFPHGSDVKPIPIQQAHTAFPEAFDVYDRQITRAILLAVREMMEAKHGSKADSGTAENVGKKVVGFLRQSFCDVFLRDVIRPLVRYNFGDDALPLLPRISLGDIDRVDWTTHAQAAAQLGYKLHATQFAEMDERLGVPVRDEEAMEEYDEHQMDKMARRTNAALDSVDEAAADEENA